MHLCLGTYIRWIQMSTPRGGHVSQENKRCISAYVVYDAVRLQALYPTPINIPGTLLGTIRPSVHRCLVPSGCSRYNPGILQVHSGYTSGTPQCLMRRCCCLGLQVLLPLRVCVPGTTKDTCMMHPVLYNLLMHPGTLLTVACPASRCFSHAS